MTATRTIRIVNNNQPVDIGEDAFDLARAQLLRARICGNPAEISFRFVKRLMDELDRRRREDAELAQDVGEILAEFLDDDDASCIGVIVDDDSDVIMEIPTEWEDFDTFDFAGLEITSLADLESLSLTEEVAPEPLPVSADEDTAIINYKPVPTSRRVGRHRVLLSPSRRWKGSVNGWRVLALSVAAVFIMCCAALLTGCNHRTRVYAGPTFVDKVGPCVITYRNINQEALDVDPNRRACVVYSATAHVGAFTRDWGKLPAVILCDVFMRPNSSPTHVCGRVEEGECGDTPYLYHALFHHWLYYTGADYDWGHGDAGWSVVHARCAELRADYVAKKCRHPRPHAALKPWRGA